MYSSQPRGFTFIGIFLFFAASMAALAAVTLLWPGTPLDRAWKLNPDAHAQLAPHARIIGPLFLLLSFTMVAAGSGWFLRRRWAWRLSLVIIGIQMVGDTVNCLRGDWLRGISGVVIAGALFWYMLRPAFRAEFREYPK